MSCFEQFFGMGPRVPPRQPSGCLAYPLEPKGTPRRSHKLASKVRTCIFIGYSSAHKDTYILLDLHSKEVIYRRAQNTTVIPDTFPAKHKLDTAQLSQIDMFAELQEESEEEDLMKKVTFGLSNQQLPVKRRLRTNPQQTTPSTTLHDSSTPGWTYFQMQFLNVVQVHFGCFRTINVDIFSEYVDHKCEQNTCFKRITCKIRRNPKIWDTRVVQNHISSLDSQYAKFPVLGRSWCRFFHTDGHFQPAVWFGRSCFSSSLRVRWSQVMSV